MAVFKVKLAILQGSTFRKSWTLKTGAPALPVDLTGYTARLQMRADLDAPVALFTLTTENGGITLGGAAGTIDLYLSHTATAAITWDSAVYDLELINTAGNGDVTRRVEGSVTVSREVTRD